MTAGSGLQLPTLDELVDQARPGVLAVLGAADTARDKLQDAQFLASFAPDPIYYAQCVCGSVAEIRPSDGRTDLTSEDRAFIADWDDAHAYCEDDA
ncbi:hypothetical protein [Mycobacterium malmoense]|uniref:hypothetical protein n=1 Tax=Mycobacterium malmoense TaxID=1780 RepID=UPI0008F944CA|nr:hypothetical protein [Mycobacterium malmoense]OIN80201.1 hypothetical protein BMG05_13210 [Mycobacterium malmoense]